MGRSRPSERGVFAIARRMLAALGKADRRPWGNGGGEGPNGNSRGGEETRIVQAIVEFADLRVKDVMTPSVDIAALDISTSVAQAARTMSRKKSAALVVYRGKLDDIVGMVDHRSLVTAMVKRRKGLEDVVFHPVFTVASMSILDLFFKMSDLDTEHAIVVDEYGGVDGIIHVRDILERVFTEISRWRETSADGTTSIITRPDGSYIVGARCRLERIQQHIRGFRIDPEEHGDIDTVGGYVFSLAGRIPARGEILRADNGFECEILQADSRRIHRLRIIPTGTPRPKKRQRRTGRRGS